MPKTSKNKRAVINKLDPFFQHPAIKIFVKDSQNQVAMVRVKNYRSSVLEIHCTT